MAARKRAKTEKQDRRQARLVADAVAAMRDLIARIPRRWDYAAEPALTFDPRQGRGAGGKSRR